MLGSAQLKMKIKMKKLSSFTDSRALLRTPTLYLKCRSATMGMARESEVAVIHSTTVSLR